MTGDTKKPNLASPYELLGGEAPLRAIIVDFVSRVTRDMMIGFFFRAIDREKLIQLEFEFAASHLGGPQTYSGRPLQTAHRAHPIMGGQFNRRLKLLEETLRDHRVPAEVTTAWLLHNESLRSLITRDTKNECNDPRSPENLSSNEQKGK